MSLTYRTSGPVEPEVAKAVAAAASRESRGHSWVLCEPPLFHPVEEDGHLFGSSKLHLQPYPDEMAELEESPAGENDFRALLGILGRASGKHHLTWELEIEGEPVGSIVDGECPEAVYSMLDGMAELALDLGELAEEEEEPEDAPNPGGLRIWREPDEEEE